MIYIHIPYCHRKCTYCAFYSRAGKRDLDAFVTALCGEIAQREEPKREVQTLYFGGGTPTILTLNHIQTIWNCLSKHFDLSHLEECTIEANPEDLSEEYLHNLHSMGFNRLSVGIQSFRDEDLKRLNRIHTSEQAVTAVKTAKKVGFSNISIDLIFGLPQQSIDAWKENLRMAESLDIQHLSCYALTVEEGSMLHRQLEQGQFEATSDEVLATHYAALCQWAKNNGFEHYEVSNFCKPGFHSRHNSHYWDRTQYLGFGPAAHSFDGIHRRWNISDTERYIAETVPFEQETLTKEDAHNEYVMTALRTSIGIEKSRINPDFLPQLEKGTKKYVSAGLIIETETSFLPTEEGLLHADGIAADLFV